MRKLTNCIHIDYSLYFLSTRQYTRSTCVRTLKKLHAHTHGQEVEDATIFFFGKCFKATSELLRARFSPCRAAGRVAHVASAGTDRQQHKRLARETLLLHRLLLQLLLLLLLRCCCCRTSRCVCTRRAIAFVAAGSRSSGRRSSGRCRVGAAVVRRRVMKFVEIG
jgi:hypothetical protein